MKNFDTWFNKFRKTVADWKYYTDFPKVYSRAAMHKKELNKINSIVGSKNIKREFKRLIKKDKSVLKAIPIIIASRNDKIIFVDEGKEILYDFNDFNKTVEDALTMLEKSGVLDLLQNHIINNLYDYVVGVEVGMDTNARKNRTGTAMEKIVEDYLKSYGFILGKTLWTQMKTTEIKEKFNIDLIKIKNQKKAIKKFDFVVKRKNKIYAIECNFYSNKGSKLSETARSYENIALQTKTIKNFKFIWITDGLGWKHAKANLEEAFNSMPALFNLDDMQNGKLIKALK